MADPRWTDETAQRLRRELGHFLIQEGALSRFDDFATHILTALADAGVLVPPGGESYDQYRTGDKLCCQLEAGSPNYVHIRPEARHTHVHTVTTWPDGTSLVSPWREVGQ